MPQVSYTWIADHLAAKKRGRFSGDDDKLLCELASKHKRQRNVDWQAVIFDLPSTFPTFNTVALKKRFQRLKPAPVGSLCSLFLHMSVQKTVLDVIFFLSLGAIGLDAA